MKLRHLLTTLFLAESTWSIYAAPKIEEITAARIFAINYTQSQETVKAQFAKGNPGGTLIPSNFPVRFDFDPLSTTNYGL